MKRLPLLWSFIAFVVLCVSLSFWGLHVFKPVNRSVAEPPMKGNVEPGAGQWGGIFGGTQGGQVAPSNYDLKGIIIARKNLESLAIVAANGKTAQAVALNGEIAPGVVLKEVHEKYVMISESGVLRRVPLPENAIVNIVPGSVRNPGNEAPLVTPIAPVGFPPRAPQSPPVSSNGPPPSNNPNPPNVAQGFPEAPLPIPNPGNGK